MIASSLLHVKVTLLDINEAAVKKGLDGIRSNLTKMVKKKKITEVSGGCSHTAIS